MSQSNQCGVSEDCGDTEPRLKKSCIKDDIEIDKCSCSYTEISDQNGGPRTFKQTCRKNNQTLVCFYSGNPHCCSAYNKNGQKQFYMQLGKAISNSQCRDPFNHCPDTSRGYYAAMCGDTHGLNTNSNFYFQS